LPSCSTFVDASPRWVARATVNDMQVLTVTLVSLAVFGLWQLGRRLQTLRGERRRADAWLETATGAVVPPRYARRAAELQSIRNRRMLARTLRAIAARATDARPYLHRPRLGAVRRRATAVEELAATLEQEGKPVTPAGMLRVAELIHDGAGPLWGASPERLEREIELTLRLLAPARGSGLHAPC
jgi:hypothetical protein